MNPYSTHLVVNSLLLEHLARKKKLSWIVEFGMGTFSTPLFARYAEKVISYEMQDVEWFTRIMDKKMPNVKLLLSLGPKNAVEHFDTLAFCMGTPPFVFVDGHQESRHHCIQKAMEHGVANIVFHDTEQQCYHYEEIKTLPGYVWIDVRDALPWTSVLTTQSSVVDLFQRACIDTVIRSDCRGE
jgi:hypothetical protein